MTDHTSSVPNYALLTERTERERRDLRNRNAISLALTGVTAALTIAYVAVMPGRIDAALLGAAITSAVVLIAWVHRCSGSQEHQRLERQAEAVLAHTDELLTAVEAARLEHRTAFARLAASLHAALDALESAAAAEDRERRVGAARTSLAEAIGYLNLDERASAHVHTGDTERPRHIDMTTWRRTRRTTDDYGGT